MTKGVDKLQYDWEIHQNEQEEIHDDFYELLQQLQTLLSDHKFCYRSAFL